MKIVTKTIEYAIRVFDPGEKVVSTSRRSGFDVGTVMTVQSHHPRSPEMSEDYGILFFLEEKNNDHQYGRSDEYWAVYKE